MLSDKAVFNISLGAVMKVMGVSISDLEVLKADPILRQAWAEKHKKLIDAEIDALRKAGR
jgi:uncharacterized membrane protein